MAVIASHGASIEHQPLSTGVYSDIPEAYEVTPPELSRNPIDTTVHASTSERAIPSPLKRNGNLSFTILFDSANTVHQALKTSYDSGNVDGWRVNIPKTGVGSSTQEFDGFVMRFNPVTGKEDEALMVEVEVDVTGDVTVTL